MVIHLHAKGHKSMSKDKKDYMPHMKMFPKINDLTLMSKVTWRSKDKYVTTGRRFRENMFLFIYLLDGV